MSASALNFDVWFLKENLKKPKSTTTRRIHNQIPKHSAIKITCILLISFLLAFVIPALGILAARSNELYLHHFNLVSIFSFLFGIYVIVATILLSGPFDIRFNFSNEKRSAMISNMFERANSEIIISSGNCDSNIYENDNVVKALQSALEQDVDLILLLRKDELDSESKKLAQLISSNKNIIMARWPNDEHSVPNDFIIVDRKHFRLEFFSKTFQDHKSDKLAGYIYNDPKFVKEFLVKISKTTALRKMTKIPS